MTPLQRIDILRDNIDRRREFIPQNAYYLAECDKWQKEIDEDLLNQETR